MGEILISFVIPMYNAENHMDNCLIAILSEIRYNYEVIIVDDGSTDRTKSIADQYASEDDRIKVVHIENSGQGYARNLGLSLSCGEYIMFVDSDDTIIRDGLKDLLELARNHRVDVACGAYYRVEAQQEIVIGTEIASCAISWNGDKEEEEWFNRFRNQSSFGYMWNKLYRREFLLENHIILDEAKNVFMEDFVFNLKIIDCKPKYYYVQIPVYRFDVRHESTTRKPDDAITEKAITTLDSYYSYLDKGKLYSENRSILLLLAMRILSYSLIKNVPYEGVSYKKTLYRIEKYLDSEVYQILLKEKEVRKAFATRVSAAEQLLYTYSFLLLKCGCKRLLALTYVIATPIFTIYLNKNVK